MKAPKEKDHYLIRAIEYGLNPDNELFTLKGMLDELKLSPGEFTVIKNLLAESVAKSNPNHIMYIVDNLSEKGGVLPIDDCYCTLLKTAIDQYNEYEELKLARENAEEARKQANTANRYAIAAIILAVFFGVTQLIFN
jgi:hypothetical protein